jgi:hypothetical protein
MNIFISNDVLTFIIVLCLAAADFWTVKNVTGRILVNLRWWSDIDPLTGNEKWVYESNNEARPVNSGDSFVFWTALYATPCVWALFAFMDLISFKFFWMYSCLLCLVLSGINTLGFYRCQKDHKNKVQSFLQQKTMGFMLGNAFGGMRDMISKVPIPGVNRS